MLKCDVRGRESKIAIGSFEKTARYCLKCHKRMLAEFIDEDLPDFPKDFE
ncbi:hypothetical protein AGMMS49957_13620 [Synergistales bacterium]|nr:hypothetical protein AGMMS49957_13620 [Synergistales bacterium]